MINLVSTQGMDELINNAQELGLEDGPVLELTLDAAEVEPPAPVQKWSLYGRFLTERYIKVNTMQNVMEDLWQLRKGLFVEVLGPNLFRFDFLQRERVVKGAPWTFEQHLLLFKKEEDLPEGGDLILNYAEFWIQVYDLPAGLMSERVAVMIGNSLGVFVESDPNNFNGFSKSYIRIRVSINATKKLCEKMMIGKDGATKTWIYFKYERLPQFCFFCACIGHADRFCPTLLDHPNPEQAVRRYSTSLRAPTKKNVAQPQSKYLLPELPVMVPSDNTRKPAGGEEVNGSGSSGSVATKISQLENKAQNDTGHIHVVETKRRRQEHSVKSDDGLSDTSSMDCDANKNVSMPKNLRKAGSAQQARQGL